MIRNVMSKISDIFKWISGILIGLTVLLNFVAVFMRYLFNRPIAWCEEVSLLMFVTSLAFSLIPLTFSRRAVKLDFFTDMMGEKGKTICKVIVDFICFFALLATSVLGIELMKRSKYRSTAILEINYRVIYLGMVIGMAISALFYTYFLYEDIANRNAKEAIK